jgi:hypothetical protein
VGLLLALQRPDPLAARHPVGPPRRGRRRPWWIPWAGPCSGPIPAAGGPIAKVMGRRPAGGRRSPCGGTAAGRRGIGVGPGGDHLQGRPQGDNPRILENQGLPMAALPCPKVRRMSP